MLMERQIIEFSNEFGVVFADQCRNRGLEVAVVHECLPVSFECASFIHRGDPEENTADCPNIGFMGALFLFEEFRSSIRIRPSLFRRGDNPVLPVFPAVHSKSEIGNQPAII